MKAKELKLKIKELSSKINAPLNLLPQVNESNDYAKPFIEMETHNIFYYVIRERGVEYERILYRDEEKLLYRVFKDITFEMSKDYEAKNRDNNQDFRIILFKKQNKLMGLLHDHWGIQSKLENDKYFES